MISAKLIQASKYVDKFTAKTNYISSYELEYPRIVHSEFLTHRVFSKNSASSRAIPVKSNLALLENEIAYPVRWGENQAGMQDKGVNSPNADKAKEIWDRAAESAKGYAAELQALNMHKQIPNRLLEPFSHMKVVLTFTEYSNWKELRKHKDADPTIASLAEALDVEYNKAMDTAMLLYPGEFHVPYIDRVRGTEGIIYSTGEDDTSKEILDPGQALKVSASCCAQVSYRKNDTSLSKAMDLFYKLILSRPAHASPVEHQATPIECSPSQDSWPLGITHKDRYGNYWSGNFKGWIQHRQIIGI